MPHTMHLPRTIATVIDAEQAEEVIAHLRGAIDSGAPTILLYTTLNHIKGNPTNLADFPPPNLHVNQTVYVLGIGMEPDDYLARVGEHSDHIEKD